MRRVRPRSRNKRARDNDERRRTRRADPGRGGGRRNASIGFSCGILPCRSARPPRFDLFLAASVLPAFQPLARRGRRRARTSAAGFKLYPPVARGTHGGDALARVRQARRVSPWSPTASSEENTFEEVSPSLVAFLVHPSVP